MSLVIIMDNPKEKLFNIISKQYSKNASLKDFVFFLGAGISIDPPSSAPSWNELRDNILRDLMTQAKNRRLIDIPNPSEIIKMIYDEISTRNLLAKHLRRNQEISEWSKTEVDVWALPLKEKHNWLFDPNPKNTFYMSSLKNKTLFRSKRQANIAQSPEMLFYILKKNARNSNEIVTLLECLNLGKPNHNHFAISSLVKNGLKYVITTNFDTYIENALENDLRFRRGKDYYVLTTKSDYNDFTQKRFDECKFFIIKLHGDLRNPDSLVNSIDQVNRVLSPELSNLLSNIVQNRYLIFWGYSGRDIELIDKLCVISKYVRYIFYCVYTDTDQCKLAKEIQRENINCDVVHSKSLLTDIVKIIDVTPISAQNHTNKNATRPSWKNHLFQCIEKLSDFEIICMIWDLFCTFGSGTIIQEQIEKLCKTCTNSNSAKKISAIEQKQLTLKVADRSFDNFSGASTTSLKQEIQIALDSPFSNHKINEDWTYILKKTSFSSSRITKQIATELAILSTDIKSVERKAELLLGASFINIVYDDWREASVLLNYFLELIESNSLVFHPDLRMRVGFFFKTFNKDSGYRIMVPLGDFGTPIEGSENYQIAFSYTLINYPLLLLDLDSLSRFYRWYAICLAYIGEIAASKSYLLRSRLFKQVLNGFYQLFLENLITCRNETECIAAFHSVYSIFCEENKDSFGAQHHVLKTINIIGKKAATELNLNIRKIFIDKNIHTEIKAATDNEYLQNGILRPLGLFFETGQLWAFKRNNGKLSIAKILKITDTDIADIIIHISVGKKMYNSKDALLREVFVPEDIEIGHLPIRLDMFEVSVVDICGNQEVLKEELRGYEKWLEAFHKGQANSFWFPLSECLEYTRKVIKEKETLDQKNKESKLSFSHIKNDIETEDNDEKKLSSNFYDALKIAMQYGYKRDFPKAIKWLSKAININPSNPEGYYWRGLAHGEMGNLKKAILDFEMAVEFNSPDSVDAYHKLGRLYELTNDYDNAIKRLSKSIELRPYVSDVFFDRGRMYAKLEKYDLAINDFEKTIKLNPNHKEAHFSRGLMNFILEEYSKALNDFEYSRKLDTEYGNAHYYCALCRFKLNDMDLALIDLEKAAQLNVIKAKELLRKMGIRK